MDARRWIKCWHRKWVEQNNILSAHLQTLLRILLMCSLLTYLQVEPIFSHSSPVDNIPIHSWEALASKGIEWWLFVYCYYFFQERTFLGFLRIFLIHRSMSSVQKARPITILYKWNENCVQCTLYSTQVQWHDCFPSLPYDFGRTGYYHANKTETPYARDNKWDAIELL